MPRPTKLTPARQRAICNAIERGATYGHAAEACGVHRDTLQAWRRDNPAFSAAITRAAAKSELALLEVLHAAAPDDWRAAGFILERRWPDDWGKRSRVDANVSGSLDTDVRTVVRQVGAVLGIVLGDDPDRRDWAAALLQAVDDGWDPTTQPVPPIPKPESDSGPFPWQPAPVLPPGPSRDAGRVHPPSDSRGTSGTVDDDFRRRHTGGGTGGGVR